MYTICPKCALTLALTAADLRAGRGYVRCGRCVSVFNALPSLHDEVGSAPTPLSPTVPAQLAAAQPVQETAPEPAGPLAVAEPDDEDLEFHPEMSDVRQVFIEPEAQADDHATGTFENIVLEAEANEAEVDEPDGESQQGEGTSSSGFYLIEDEFDVADAPAVEAEDVWVLESGGANDSASEIDVDDLPAANDEYVKASATHAVPAEPGDGEDFAAEQIEETTARRRRLLQRSGAALLGVLLTAQLFHASRDALAGTAAFGNGVRAFYSAVGHPLRSTFDVAKYDVRQLGADTDPVRKALVVRASVANAAAQAQPYPVLRLTVQDRFGKSIAARNLEPKEYLQRPAAAASLLTPGERIDAEIVLADPGTDAVGFEVDACLTLRDGLRCANGLQAAQ
ncbi:MAG: zinc-ribbon and DUF3426 domain-containing protein [Steroidobacteraceae bacterium]